MKLRKIMGAILAALLLVASMPVLEPPALAAYNMPYYIEVDVVNQIVTIYSTSTDVIVRQMICSTGKENSTPHGTYYLPRKKEESEREPWYYFRMFSCYAQYATRIFKGVMFHSIPCSGMSQSTISKKNLSELGTPASHGCVRLRWQDAEFIAENCLPGTRVRIHKSGQRNEALRELLLQESYDASTGLSYDSFLGVSGEEGALCRSSQGPEVLDLQYRLRDLGLYGGELSGSYDSATVNAVRTAQYLMGADVNGVATAAFREAVYGPDAPTAMEVCLSEGMSGPAVRVLQDDLAALRLYGDVPDSVYDVAVVEAVKDFQRAYGYEANGVAAPEVQKAVAYEVERLRQAFGDADYTLERVAEPLTLARVKARAGLKLRERATQDSRALKRLSAGAKMIVIERGDGWSRVRAGGEEGYVKDSLAEFADGEVVVLKYTSGADGSVCAIGNALGDYVAGSRLPCDVFEEYLAANDRQVDVSQLVSYVTVDAGESGAAPLYSGPNAESPALDAVENGMSLRVGRRYADWTLVTCRGREGYLQNQYLTFWTGPEDALDEALDAGRVDVSMVRCAVVESATDEDAAVYDADSDDARVLGHLKDATEVEVREILDGWCLIRYRGHEGYMIGEDLRLVLEGDPVGDEGEDGDEPDALPTEPPLL